MKWWRHVCAMELRKILAYRSDFWITFLGQTLIQVVIARALWSSIFSANDATVMNGFTLEMMALYYLIVPLGNKILAGENVGFVAREIYDGTFSRYLIYPLSAFQYKTMTFLTHSSFYMIQLLLIVSGYVLLFQTELFTLNFLLQLVTGAGIFLLAALAYMLLALSLELIALWADNIWSLVVMLRFFTAFLGGGSVPLTFFPEWAQKVVYFTPFPYLISLPVRTIMGSIQTEEILKGILILIGWIFIMMEVVKFIWKKGQLRFTGVGQ